MKAWLGAVLAVVVFVAPVAAIAVEPLVSIDEASLYKAETIVTGTGEAERLRGFLAGGREVFIKLTGDAKLADGAKGKALIKRAPELIAEFIYEDRMKDIPVHDEQGTRDRPHYLRMRFDAAKLDAALRESGMRKWEGKRPLVSIWLTIDEPRGRYVLSNKGAEGYGQREVLKDASVRYGLPILLPDNTPPPGPPSQTTLKPAADSFAPLLRRNIDILAATGHDSALLEADGILTGTLSFDGKAHWKAQWFLVGKGVEGSWWQEGVSFDVALKYAIERTVGAYVRPESRKTQQKREK